MKHSKQILLPLDQEKRWDQRRERWRRSDVVIRPEEFGYELISKALAEAFGFTHHYECKFPPTYRAVGLYRKTGVHPARLVGVAAFTVPIQGAAITCYTGLSKKHGAELGRFALHDEVAFNGESWFLSRALRVLHQECGAAGMRGVISYADPMERVNHLLDEVVKRAHYGGIYKALNALYNGRSRAQWIWLTPTGYVLNRRTIDKIRKEESGFEGGMAHFMRSFGAPRREPGEQPREWLARILPLIATRVRHPGNHVYSFGLTRATREHIYEVNNGGLPYPLAPLSAAA